MYTQKFGSRVSYTLARVLVLLGLGIALGASAHNKVVVVPLGGGEAQKLSNVVTVAKSNGDFSEPIAALNSITDASESNPYLIVIAPGVYTLSGPLQMKEWVSIAGSGRYVTKLTGAISTSNTDSSSAVVSGANNASLSDISVENTGGSEISIAILSFDTSTILERVNALSSGGTSKSYGIRIDRNAASPIINNTMASATSSSSTQSDSYGIYCRSDSSPIITNVIATGTGNAGENYGFFNNSSSATIDSSELSGSTFGLHIGTVGSSGVYVTNTKIIGGVDNDPQGTTECRNTYDENLNDITC